ncbi:MAG: YitT family protein, partial [Bacilli bacterium]|nr:YitT family protein [Bacilli bacterium]
MKNLVRGFNVVIGCLLVAISINYFLIPSKLISFGFDGLATLIYYNNNVRPEVNLLIMNV